MLRTSAERARVLARAGWRAADDEAYDQARTAFAQAVALAPAVSAYWNGYAVSLARLGRAAEACQALEHSLRLAPNDIAIWCIYGEISAERGDLRMAAQAFARCLSLDPRGAHPSGVRARALVKRIAKKLKK